MKTFLAVLFCLGALGIAARSSADEASDKAALAARIVDRMPFWALSGENEVRTFLDTKVFPLMQRRGVKKAMAAALAEEMTANELAVYSTMLEDETYRKVLTKLARANVMMQGILGTEMTIAIRCFPLPERPEPLRKSPEFNAAEKEYFCK